MHPKNLDWIKAKKWGDLIHSENGMSWYQWKNKLYVIEESVNQEIEHIEG